MLYLICRIKSLSPVQKNVTSSGDSYVMSVSSTQIDQFYARRPIHLYVLSYFVTL